MNLIAQLATMRLGVRVRAPISIFYAHSGIEIAEGTLGTIQIVTHAGALVGVLWDGEKEAIATAFTSVEVLPS